eukprot:scaffold562570_cov22-Prasinocladus_malaysianus.AAC.1
MTSCLPRSQPDDDGYAYAQLCSANTTLIRLFFQLLRQPQEIRLGKSIVFTLLRQICLRRISWLPKETRYMTLH